MAADMERNRSSECPDGTLAPSDGQSMERAESPTPGLAQGMEPGMGRVCSSRQMTVRAASRATGIPTKSFIPTHSSTCPVTRGQFVRCWGYCRAPGSVCVWPSSPLHVGLLSLCCLAASMGSPPVPWVYCVPSWLLFPPSALSLNVTSARVRPACSDHALYRTVVILSFYLFLLFLFYFVILFVYCPSLIHKIVSFLSTE